MTGVTSRRACFHGPAPDPVTAHTSSDKSHTDREQFSLYCPRSLKKRATMKVRYQLRPLTREQRVVMEYLLLDEMETQRWYHVLRLQLWRTEGLVCTQ
jgi:hypothetical protein